MTDPLIVQGKDLHDRLGLAREHATMIQNALICLRNAAEETRNVPLDSRQVDANVAALMAVMRHWSELDEVKEFASQGVRELLSPVDLLDPGHVMPSGRHARLHDFVDTLEATGVPSGPGEVNPHEQQFTYVMDALVAASMAAKDPRYLITKPSIPKRYEDGVRGLRWLCSQAIAYAMELQEVLEAIGTSGAARNPWLHALRQIDDLHYSEFEHFIASLLDRDGYRIVRSGGGSGDQGADVLAMDGLGQYLVVQCKHFSGGAGSVGQPVAQHLFGGAYAMQPAALPILVTNGKFTGRAKAWSRQNHRVRLVGREGLAQWSKGGQGLASVIRAQQSS
ncbi:restriction endonuclease [Streptomyces goshikiensis]|uniref:restriction endonuclease n=1 Tax=Streptomyces goshikiensis TaxID=1942 RepID=UPI003677EBD4